MPEHTILVVNMIKHYGSRYVERIILRKQKSGQRDMFQVRR